MKNLYRIYREKGLSVEKARDAADAYKKKYGDYDPKHEFEVEHDSSSNPMDPHVHDSDIEAYRNELGNPLDKKTDKQLNTVALGKTNVNGLEGMLFKGASSKVRKAAGLDDLDEVYPNRTVKAPYDVSKSKSLAQYTKHAEEGVMAEFENAVKKLGLNPINVKGDLYIIQSNSNGVCNKCTLDLFTPSSDGRKGIFKQFSEMYPNLNIHVSTYSKGGEGKGHGAISFDLKNGKVTNKVVK